MNRLMEVVYSLLSYVCPIDKYDYISVRVGILFLNLFERKMQYFDEKQIIIFIKIFLIASSRTRRDDPFF